MLLEIHRVCQPEWNYQVLHNEYMNSLRIQQDSEEKLRRYNLDTNIISFVHAIGSQDNGAILLNFYHSPID